MRLALAFLYIAVERCKNGSLSVIYAKDGEYFLVLCIKFRIYLHFFAICY